MAENNGHKDEKIPKKCPFFHTPCIGNECSLHVELMQSNSGFQKKFGMCSFPAMIMILSEMNMKTSLNPLQKIQIPNILKS